MSETVKKPVPEAKKPPEQIKEIDPKVYDNIFKKIHGVMSELKNVEKNGFNENQKYSFAKETDFVDAVKPLLTKYRLVMLPNLKALTIRETGEDKTSKPPTKPTFLTTVEVEYTVIDIDTKERETFCIAGQGADRGDKGIYKALTGAKKYAYSTGFHISTGDDPENKTPGEAKETKSKVVSGGKKSSKNTDYF